MLRYLIKRLLLLIPIAFVVSSVVFLLIHLVPGNPVDFMLGEQAVFAEREALTHELHLDRPISEQYFYFLRDLGKGNLGTSVFDHRPVLEHIRERYLATFLLACGAMFVGVILGISLGVLAAVKKYSWADSFSMFIALLGISMPNFWLGPLLILFLCVYLHWLPVGGLESPASLILPSLTLGFAMSAMISRMTRSSMLDVLKKEYVLTARAKGLAERRVIFKHALKNALNPVLTIMGLQLGTLFAGAVVTEKVFNWPGLGSLLMDSIQSRDYPVVQGCVLVMSLSYVCMNALTDCLYRWVDPRIKYG